MFVKDSVRSKTRTDAVDLNIRAFFAYSYSRFLGQFLSIVLMGNYISIGIFFCNYVVCGID